MKRIFASVYSWFLLILMAGGGNFCRVFLCMAAERPFRTRMDDMRIFSCLYFSADAP